VTVYRLVLQAAKDGRNVHGATAYAGNRPEASHGRALTKEKALRPAWSGAKPGAKHSHERENESGGLGHCTVISLNTAAATAWHLAASASSACN
jgi:hypothetical protein